MNNYALEQAEELFEQALEYFLGIEKEKKYDTCQRIITTII